MKCKNAFYVMLSLLLFLSLLLMTLFLKLEYIRIIDIQKHYPNEIPPVLDEKTKKELVSLNDSLFKLTNEHIENINNNDIQMVFERLFVITNSIRTPILTSSYLFSVVNASGAFLDVNDKMYDFTKQNRQDVNFLFATLLGRTSRVAYNDFIDIEEFTNNILTMIDKIDVYDDISYIIRDAQYKRFYKYLTEIYPYASRTNKEKILKSCLQIIENCKIIFSKYLQSRYFLMILCLNNEYIQKDKKIISIINTNILFLNKIVKDGLDYQKCDSVIKEEYLKWKLHESCVQKNISKHKDEDLSISLMLESAQNDVTILSNSHIQFVRSVQQFVESAYLCPESLSSDSVNKISVKN